VYSPPQPPPRRKRVLNAHPRSLSVPGQKWPELQWQPLVLALQTASLSEDVLLLCDNESHRGEPIHERADSLEEEGREMSNDDNQWDDHTDHMTLEVRRGNTTVCSVWTNSVRNVLHKQAGWAKLQEARATAARHWTERVWYCHNQHWMRALKEGTAASRSGK
jgi:hypothetical protein